LQAVWISKLSGSADSGWAQIQNMTSMKKFMSQQEYGKTIILQLQSFLQQIDPSLVDELDAMAKKPLLFILFIIENTCKLLRNLLQ
jgi:hypothetical protein